MKMEVFRAWSAAHALSFRPKLFFDWTTSHRRTAGTKAANLLYFGCMRWMLVFVVMATCTLPGIAQDLTLYRSSKQLFVSKSCGDSLPLDLHFPKTFSPKSKRQLPVVFLFDSQNENTHRHNLSSIDMLTYHGQMPEVLVVGIAFSENNRYALTSNQKLAHNQSTGLEATAKMLFAELLPQLQEKYGASGPVLILGHSRTAYLVNYLYTHHGNKLAFAGCFSGFFEPGCTRSDFQKALLRFSEEQHGPAYYASWGTDPWQEAPYASALRGIDSLVIGLPGASRVLVQSHAGAGHLMNYNLSVPAALSWFFAPYAGLFNQWLYEEVKKVPADSLLPQLNRAYAALTPLLGGRIDVPLDAYISFGNVLWQQEQWAAMEALLQQGKNTFPTDYELHYLLALSLKKQGKAAAYESLAGFETKRAKSDPQLSDSEKNEIIQAYQELASEP